MRILIIGGGMAGWTLAGLLRARGRNVTLVERVEQYGSAGFGIGLYPFSANTLRETGVYERYSYSALRLAGYVMRDSRDALLQQMSFSDVLGRIHGFMGVMRRSELLDILREGGAGSEVRMGTTVVELHQHADHVDVRFSDGNRAEFDVVLACDGMHSATRSMVTGDPRAGLSDWGFTAFTWWCPRIQDVGDDVVEYWGSAGLFAMYPLRDQLSAIAAMPTPENLGQMDQGAMVAAIREHFDAYPEAVRAALAHTGDGYVYPWPMVDHKADRWIHGRVALVGDAAIGFLPTAGVGASNAIKSAAVLADELGRADAATVPLALDLWQQRVRARVEANQAGSRALARAMFVKGHTLARVRDLALRHYPVEKVAKDVLRNNIEAW